jgi:TolB-like protein/cytochrome c-type biogenesis protein CcmH/NrfG
VAWVLLQVLSIVLPSFEAPQWVMKTIMLIMVIAFPVWVFIAWVYEVTPEGLKKTEKVSKDQSISATTNKRLNVLILVGIVAAITVTLLQPKTGYMSSSDTVEYSIAVLPFDNMSTDKDNEWFCDGVTEDILTYLSKVSGLRVISRTSVMQYKKTDKTIPEIAAELGVSYVVEGSVRKQNNQVLITAQLIKANDGHVWSDKYNENLSDVFKIQQEVSKKIVQQLQIHLSPEEEQALSTAATTNVDSYQLFSKGRILADTRTKEDLEKSIELYQEAIKLDSQFAEAYAEIGNSYYLLDLYYNNLTDEAIEKVKFYVNKALAINPNTVRAYTVLATIFREEKKWVKAKEYFEKAIEISPNDATAHHHFATYHRDKPEPDAKNFLIQINEAQRLDPLSNPINAAKLEALLANDKLEEAKTHFNKTSFLYSTALRITNEAFLNSLTNKDYSEFIYAFVRALSDQPNNSELNFHLSFFYRGIFNDQITSLKYAKKAFELEPSYNRNAYRYMYALYYNKQFEAAKKLLDDASFLDLFDMESRTTLLLDYHAYQGQYKEAITYLEQLKGIDFNSYYFQKGWLYSRMGDAKTTYEILNSSSYQADNWDKAVFFASLKETDSMYHYLDKISNPDDIIRKNFSMVIDLNGREEFDPYRKEPRYITFLKKNYIPVDKQKN